MKWRDRALEGLTTASRTAKGEVVYNGKTFATISDYAEYVRPKEVAYQVWLTLHLLCNVHNSC